MGEHYKKSSAGFMRLRKAFGYSLEGLRAAWRHEAAFRQEALLAAVMIPVALWLPVGHAAKGLLIGSVLMVLIVELLNSAIEAAIDRISPETHELAKRAKDIGSAAVLMSLANALIIWVLVLTT